MALRVSLLQMWTSVAYYTAVACKQAAYYTVLTRTLAVQHHAVSALLPTLWNIRVFGQA